MKPIQLFVPTFRVDECLAQLRISSTRRHRDCTSPSAFSRSATCGAMATRSSAPRTREGREVGNLVLDPAYRGQGIMRHAVEQLCAEPGTYFAEVKAGNDPSLRVFTATGFGPEVIRLYKRV